MGQDYITLYNIESVSLGSLNFTLRNILKQLGTHFIFDSSSSCFYESIDTSMADFCVHSLR